MDKQFSFSDACSDSVDSVKRQLDAALKGVREEFDDHLDSINENTSEIEANYELLCRLESKVDRLQVQVEHLQLALSAISGAPKSSELPESIELDEKEKELFLVLYTAPDNKPVTYKELAAAVRESEFLARGYVTNMIEKGVPVMKRYINDTAYISLESSFKERQARLNIVKLSQLTVPGFLAAKERGQGLPA